VNADATLDILIRGCTALTAEPGAEPLRDAAIGIRGDRIAFVAASGQAEGLAARRVIDGRGFVATPGFVNVHTHAVLSHARGMVEDAGFAPAYTSGVPHASDVREDEAIALARLTALEAMLFGSTLINDMYIHDGATVPAMAELGLRISCSAWLHDVDFSRIHEGVWNHEPAIGARTMHAAHDLAGRWQGGFDGRVTVMLGPHAIDTCSKAFLRDVDVERRRMGVRVMTHLAQSRIEVAQVMRRDGMTPAEVVDDAGLLDDALIATHCTVMTDSDIERVGRAGATIAHAAKVNMTGGYLPLTSRLRRAGAAIALGTDNMFGDMVESMRWTLIAGRLQEGEVNDFWQSRDVFHMATLGAARAMGRERDLGSLAPGKKADVVLFDFRRAHLTPSHNPLATLVHAATGRDATMVVVDGRIVVEDGRATMVDEERIRREAAAAAASLWGRVTGAH
jgi:5-methylthioadenosine/S-adenosylhomocysteine deaminase